jgi:hypothetical protein
MVKKTIELEAKADKAIDEIEKLKKQIEDLNKEVVSANKKTEDGLKGVEDASKATAKGLRGIGTAIKAIGIGLLLEAFNFFKETIGENQKAVDFFATTFETLSLAFNDFINFVSDNFGAVTGFFKGIFEDPIGSIKDFGTAITEGIVNRVKQAIEVLGLLGKAAGQFFTGDFTGAMLTAKEAGKELFDVITGQEGGFEAVTNAVKNTVNAVTNYTKSTIDAAKANVELNKQAEVARVLQQGLVETYDRQAERLRQVRDEERNTIDERIAANNELKSVLEEQQAAMLELVDLQIKSAQAQYDKNQNQENYIALLEATQEREAVLAQIEGFRSEQLSNDLALSREQLELQNSLRDAAFERALSEEEFNASLIGNEVARLQREKEINEEYSAIREKQLRDDLARTKLGTQAQVDATNALFDFQEETRQKELQLEADIQAAKIDVISNALGGVAQLIGEDSKFGKAIAVTQAIMDTYAGANKAFAQGGIFGGIAAAGIIASGIANVRAITATETPDLPSFATGGGGTFAASVPTPPQINTVGTSGVNQLAETINAQTKEPMKAYVVAGEVTTAQSLERNAVKEASI